MDQVHVVRHKVLVEGRTQRCEMIAQAVYAITHDGVMSDLSATIHPYPTQAEGFRQAGDVYRRGSLTPTVLRWLVRYFKWTRGQ